LMQCFFDCPNTCRLSNWVSDVLCLRVSFVIWALVWWRLRLVSTDWLITGNMTQDGRWIMFV
jgi:hypothetical protein